MRNRCYKRYRRGISLLEVVVSLAIITLLSSLVVASVSVSLRHTQTTKAYTAMKVYAVDLLGRIEADMEAHAADPAGAQEIIYIDYNDDGETANAYGDVAGIKANVLITDLGGDVIGKQAYLVSYELKDLLSNVSVSGNAFLREGSDLNVP